MINQINTAILKLSDITQYYHAVISLNGRIPKEWARLMHHVLLATTTCLAFEFLPLVCPDWVPFLMPIILYSALQSYESKSARKDPIPSLVGGIAAGAMASIIYSSLFTESLLHQTCVKYMDEILLNISSSETFRYVIIEMAAIAGTAVIAAVSLNVVKKLCMESYEIYVNKLTAETAHQH